MKKIFTILFAGLLTLSLSAQTDAGTLLLSGATGLDFASQSVTSTDPSDAWDDDNTSKATNMELKLLGGFFMADGLVGGIAVNYKSESQKSVNVQDFYSGGDVEQMEKSTTITTIIAPTIRYYIAESGAWVQASYGFGSMTEKSEYEIDYPSGYNNYDDSDSDKESNPMTIFSIGAGYAIYLSDYISLNPTIGYAMSTVKIEDGYTEYNYNPYTGYSTYDEEDLTIKMSGITFGLGIALHLE
tara:strand:- start:115 stop:840 length:726 start_codon:yes stop_codon:yes gene_type:complete